MAYLQYEIDTQRGRRFTGAAGGLRGEVALVSGTVCGRVWAPTAGVAPPWVPYPDVIAALSDVEARLRRAASDGSEELRAA